MKAVEAKKIYQNQRTDRSIESEAEQESENQRAERQMSEPEYDKTQCDDEKVNEPQVECLCSPLDDARQDRAGRGRTGPGWASWINWC